MDFPYSKFFEFLFLEVHWLVLALQYSHTEYDTVSCCPWLTCKYFPIFPSVHHAFLEFKRASFGLVLGYVEESFTFLSPSISGSSQSKERTFWYKNMRRQANSYNHMHNRKLFGLEKWMKYILQSAQKYEFIITEGPEGGSYSHLAAQISTKSHCPSSCPAHILIHSHFLLFYCWWIPVPVHEIPFSSQKQANPSYHFTLSLQGQNKHTSMHIVNNIPRNAHWQNFQDNIEDHNISHLLNNQTTRISCKYFYSKT